MPVAPRNAANLFLIMYYQSAFLAFKRLKHLWRRARDLDRATWDSRCPVALNSVVLNSLCVKQRRINQLAKQKAYLVLQGVHGSDTRRVMRAECLSG